MRDIKDDIKDLFINHKRATALDEEYTKEIYEYLVEKEFINLSPKNKYDISNQARRIYQQELHQRILTEQLEGSKIAMRAMEALKTGEVNEKMKEYMIGICRRISIKQYFDLIENLKL